MATGKSVELAAQAKAWKTRAKKVLVTVEPSTRNNRRARVNNIIRQVLAANGRSKSFGRVKQILRKAGRGK